MPLSGSISVRNQGGGCGALASVPLQFLADAGAATHFPLVDPLVAVTSSRSISAMAAALPARMPGSPTINCQARHSPTPKS